MRVFLSKAAGAQLGLPFTEVRQHVRTTGGRPTIVHTHHRRVPKAERALEQVEARMERMSQGDRSLLQDLARRILEREREHMESPLADLTPGAEVMPQPEVVKPPEEWGGLPLLLRHRIDRSTGLSGETVDTPAHVVRYVRENVHEPGKWWVIVADTRHRVRGHFIAPVEQDGYPRAKDVIELTTLHGGTRAMLARTLTAEEEAAQDAVAQMSRLARVAHGIADYPMQVAGLGLLDTVVVAKGSSFSHLEDTTYPLSMTEPRMQPEVRVAGPVRVEVRPGRERQVRGAADVARIVRDLEDADREHVVVVYTRGGKARAVEVVSVGTTAAAPVEAHLMLRSALLVDADGAYVVHNHPSGDPRPSPEDDQLTTRLNTAFKHVGRKLLDHVVVAREGYYSYKDRRPDLLKSALARLRGEAEAWLEAAERSDHPARRRALYALLGRDAALAKALVPELDWRVTPSAVDAAGAGLFGETWPVVRHRWGLAKATIAERFFVTATDPVVEFDKAQRANRLAWAAENLPDPDARAAAFSALEAQVRC